MFLQTLLKSKSVDAPIQSMDVMKRIVLPRAAGGCPHVRHLHCLRHHHPREGVVRVVNRDTDDRILIKGLKWTWWWRGSWTAWGTCLFKVT